MSKLNQINQVDIDQIITADKLTVVDFWAEWCGPCRALNPTLEALAEEYGDKLSIVKLNADDNPLAAQKHNVIGLPTLVLFHNGQEVSRIVGAQPKTTLQAAFDAELGKINGNN